MIFFVQRKWKLCSATLFSIPRCTPVYNMDIFKQTRSHNIRHLAWKSWIFVHGSSFVRTLFQDICLISSFLFLLNATMHIFVKFGYISTNYVMNVAKTPLVSLESYECLFMIASFWEHVFNKLLNCKFIFFMVTRSHIMTRREGFPLFWFFFWILYARLKI